MNREYNNYRPGGREIRSKRPYQNGRDESPRQNGEGRNYIPRGIPKPKINRKPPLQVLLVTRDISNPEDVSKRIIDYNDQDTASWLYRHTQWALYNNKTTLLLPYTSEEDYEAVEDYDIPEFDEVEESEDED